MNRREFLGVSALASLAATLGGCRSFGDVGVAVNGVRIGVQMWSVNELWRKNPAEAFRRLKALGYEGVQSYGFYAMDWNELEKLLDGEGLKIIDMPFYFKNTDTDGEFSRYVEFCRRFGIDFVYEPGYPAKKTEPERRKYVEKVIATRAKFGKVGIRMGFHNHQPELKETFDDGKTPFGLFEESPIDFELDVGHAKLAGHDPVAMLGRLKGRVPSIHAKPAGGLSIGGEGDLNDWRAIFAAAAAAGTKWAIVECEARRNTFEDVERSMAFLKSLG